VPPATDTTAACGPVAEGTAIDTSTAAGPADTPAVPEDAPPPLPQPASAAAANTIAAATHDFRIALLIWMASRNGLMVFIDAKNIPRKSEKIRKNPFIFNPFGLEFPPS
jgi:hypothetical protein